MAKKKHWGKLDEAKRKIRKGLNSLEKKNHENMSRIKLGRCSFVPSTEQDKLILRLPHLQRVLC